MKGKDLKKIRVAMQKKHGISQKAVAEMFGYTEQHFQAMEQGRARITKRFEKVLKGTS